MPWACPRSRSPRAATRRATRKGPAHAQLEVILVPEVDTFVNPLGVKGIGELGNVATPAAISSAIYRATGRRIRQLPIRLDDLL